MTTDHRAVSDLVLNLYLYPPLAWVLVFAGLYFADQAAFALPLCYPLALWQIGLSIWWGRSTMRKIEAGVLSGAEARAGVRSIGQILSWSAITPAIVFMTDDPLSQSAWSTTMGAVTVACAVYLAVMGLTRVERKSTHMAAIAIACFALPLNATGAVTVATMLGLFDVVLHATPLPVP